MTRIAGADNVDAPRIADGHARHTYCARAWRPITVEWGGRGVRVGLRGSELKGELTLERGALHGCCVCAFGGWMELERNLA